MRRETAIRLVKDWSNKVCNHPYIEDEFYFGISTGYKVCVVCGRLFGIKSTLKYYKTVIKKNNKIKFRL
jgi:hypothetical protein